MDEMVLQVQQWVNVVYAGKPGFNRAPETGKTGWSTIYALTRALQIELGIGTPADNFGNGTASAYRAWGEMEMGTVPVGTQGHNIVSILQGAMYCKGYGPGGFTGTFGEGTKAAVINLQTDAGLPVRDGKVYDYVFKAFLTMDAYVLTFDGDPRIQEMQRDLNYHYFRTSGVQPTDGHYQRGTNRALIYGIQTEEDISPSIQTGSVGPMTIDRLPTLSVGSTGRFVKLFQYALYVNGFDPGVFDGSYGSGVQSTVISFQNFTELQADGIVGKQTWLSALVSTGDPTRKGTACDCITTITNARAQALKAAGYETVGRYLVNVPGGLDKKIKPGELETIFQNDLTVFPIYQTTGRDASYFTKSQGKRDAQDAYTAAKSYGFLTGTTIYFAVDFDALGFDITNNILPYFQGINEQMNYLDNVYKVGAYGARSVCIQVAEQGWATTSFVSGMSTGFSGNLGYPLPSNWAFDQISTIDVGSGEGYIEIDNNIKSGRDNGSTSISVPSDLNEELYKQLGQIQLLALQYADGNKYQANYLTTNYYRRIRYEGKEWTITSGPFDQDFEEFVHNSVGENSFIWATDPVSKADVIDFPHMMATISALLYANLPLVGSTMQDLSGWGGDLFTVSADVYENRDNDRYSGDVSDRTYQAAYDYIGTKQYSGQFSHPDFLSDIDAINIAKALLNDESVMILTAIKDYYENDVANRFSLFFENKFSSNKSTMTEYAEEILIGLDPDIVLARQALRGSMGMNAPYYSDEEGRLMAKAFSDKIMDLMNSN
jgi:peptidoglycan hydrolase-like protein with peptidoglycan-binding domain